MKHTRLITITTLSLFFIGILSGSFVLQLTERIIGEEIVGFTTLDWLVPPVSLGALLAFCAICAGCLLWAYSRNKFEYAPQWVFGLALVISLIAAAINIGIKLLQLRWVLVSMGNEFDNIPMVMGEINYFSLGFGLPLSANVILIAILLWLSRQKQEQNDAKLPVHTN